MSKDSNIAPPYAPSIPKSAPIVRSDSSSRSSLGGSDRARPNHVASQKQSQKQKPRQRQNKSKPQHSPSIGNSSKKQHQHALEPEDHFSEDDFSNQIDLSGVQSKKFGRARKNQISINHLLDFQSYRDSQQYQVSHQHNTSSRNRRYSDNHRKHKIQQASKVHLQGMSFINVNYKFIVDHRDDYKIQQLDPNVPVDTNRILRIVVPKGNACPICLSDEPIAPRMITSCGHILCLSCLLSLLDSEIPTFKKRESSAIVEKYRDCPLCASVIRPAEVKPVLIDNVDERFEVPKIKDETVLTLMMRPQNKILPLPQALAELHHTIDNFPWVRQDNEFPDISPYSRIFKADFEYLLRMYDDEKRQILESYEQEKLLYNDDGKFVKMAIKNIDKDIESWSSSFLSELAPTSAGRKMDLPQYNPFFYYQTGYRAPSTYVLSPLDMKVLKTAYNGDYTNLPSAVVVKIENIRYDELTAETSLTKYKYLSHLPLGSSIGFLECDWSHNEYIDPETWKAFSKDLTSRSRQSQRKFRKEEKDRKIALDEEEYRTRNFFERENNPDWSESDFDYQGTYADYPSNFGSLSITDNRELPPLAPGSDNAVDAEHHDSDDLDSSPRNSGEYETTIWGTKIPKSEAPAVSEADGYDWDAEEMIRRAKEEMDKQEREQLAAGGKKKKKKKLVLLSSNSTW